jgi:hypothetical protein
VIQKFFGIMPFAKIDRKTLNIYVKTRDLLKHPRREFITLTIQAFSKKISPIVIPRDKVEELAIQLKTTRAIRRILNFAILILRPKNIIAKEHPSRFYLSIAGKTFLYLFQPLLRFRKLLQNFEIFVYIGYFGKISREHFDLFKPHPDFLKGIHCLAPYQQGYDKGTARSQSEPFSNFNNN